VSDDDERVDTELAAAQDACRRAYEKVEALHNLGPEGGAGALIWAQAIRDTLDLHESARDDARDPSAVPRTAVLRLIVTPLMLVVAIDGLRRDRIDFQARTILVDQQWNAKTHAMTLPKHGVVRTIALTEPARERLRSLPVESEYAFTTLRGSHYHPSSRSHHWNRVRCAAGLGDVDLYLATRHYFGWYALNVLGLPDHVIALQFGHQDGGELVRTRYGHPDAAIARERVRDAFKQAPAAPVPLVASVG
jgi:integrase